MYILYVIPFWSGPVEFLFLEVGLRSGFISARADAPAATAFLSLEIFWEMDLGFQDAGSERSWIWYIYFIMPWCWNQWCENTFAVPDGTIKNTKTSFRRNPPNVWWRHILFGNWKLQIYLDKSAKFGLVSKIVFYAFPKVKAKRWRKEVKRVLSLRAVHGMPLLSLGAVDTPAVAFGSETPSYYLRLAWSCQMNTLHIDSCLGVTRKYRTWSAM